MILEFDMMVLILAVLFVVGIAGQWAMPKLFPKWYDRKLMD